MSDETAAVVALVTFIVGATAGAAWRMWWQWRRTGSTGFKGLGGSVGSAEWFGGLGFVLGVLVSFAAPVLQLAGVVAPVVRSPWLVLVGIVLALVGIIGTVYAQLVMGSSWRIGVSENERTTLVREGVFGLVRNPIYVAMFVFWLGGTLIAPNIVAIVGYVLLVVSIEVQVRLVEEPHLLKVHGSSYREYAGTVGRFVPGVGLRLGRTPPRT
jgi:protein-S-isoprenylcysteine O-methyltransferase Ste14